MRYLAVMASLLAGLAPAAWAQSMTPEEIAAEVNRRVAAQNPYQALLNDPDPQRSLAAMQVMLESGDAQLIGMATEFGLLSPNPTVKRIALEGILATQPVLTVRLDGSEMEERNFANTVVGWMKGNMTPENVGFAQLHVGKYDAASPCYTDRDGANCLVTLNSDGVFVRTSNADVMRGRMELGEDGMLTGFVNLYQVSTPVPASISLLE